MTSQLLSQSSTTPTDEDRWVDPALVDRARALAARGSVLLRNDGTLPLPAGEPAALFGRVQKDWIGVGYGSGGDVNAPYMTTLLDSLRDSGAVAVDATLADLYESWCAENPVDPGTEWGDWPRCYPETPLEDSVITQAAARTQVAVVVIGRAAGEDRENTLEPGSYYLTETERDLLDRVTRAFERTVVVLSTGNLIDLSWIEDYPISSVLLAWLGGMEGGRATADILTGAVEPGGRLTAAVSTRYQDHPSAEHFGGTWSNTYVEDVFVGYRYFETFAPQAVQFPFGFGLGYTSFDITATSSLGHDGLLTVRAQVTNTGDRPGSEVVQVYVAAPDAALAAPARVLTGFARTTQLDPGQSATVEITSPVADLARYDETGVTGHRSAYVLVPGEYEVLVGADVRRADHAGAFTVDALSVVRQLEEVAAPAPEHPFERMTLRRAADGAAEVAWEPVPTATTDLRERISSRLPEEIEPTGARGIRFEDLAGRDAELDTFIAQLEPAELAALSYGDITMNSPLGTPGNAGALGGVTQPLRDHGVPAAITTDGPSGIRVSAFAALLPCGTALASSWDLSAVGELAALHGQEMLRKGSDILLAPGMNLHRNPLCGRNFEYFSEDPLLTGQFAAAVVTGVQSAGVAACPKHFAANNQETNRIHHDSRVSERALREIYLRGFEICVRESAPRSLMTSYNKINGVWGHYHYDLVTTVLRGEWGFDGVVMTDWWMRMAQDPHFPDVFDSAYRVRAQVDVLMPGSIEHSGTEREDSVVGSHRRPEGITLAEMQRSARNVLRLLLTLPR